MIETLLRLILLTVILAPDDPLPQPNEIHAAVDKALPLIVKSTAEYPKHRDCFSCHHQAVPLLAMTTARDRGFNIEADAISEQAELTEADLRTALEDYKKGNGQGGGVTRAGYALWTLEMGGKKADDITKAVTAFLLKRDENKDHWRGSSNRPPSEASEFTATYLAIRGLTSFGALAAKEQIADRVAKAKSWLADTKPKDTEDRVFRLMALKAAAADAASIHKAKDDLFSSQRDDGGWSQLDGGNSDSYATGSSLVALHFAAGLSTADAVYLRGLKYLISTQRDDGSWFVPSRSKPFQPYFESGFPYGKDQFISMAATSWATTALALACQTAAAVGDDPIDPATIKDKVTIKVGKKLFVKFDQKGNALSNPKEVEKVSNDPPTPTFDFGKMGETLTLTTKNPYSKNLKFRALARLKGRKDYFETSIVPVQSGLFSLELWQDPIEELVLFEFKLEDKK